jgi:uncharacterized DUF497 family protein
MIEFEYDPAKSESNREKHGIDFDQAQKLWMDEQALVVSARTELEPRYALIGQYQEKVWTCIFTNRSGRVRIISVRRSRDVEKEKYYNR